MLVEVKVLLTVAIFKVSVEAGSDCVFACVHSGRHVAELVFVSEVAARRVHIGDEILGRLLDLKLIVCDYCVSFDHLREIVVTEAHVFDGQTLAQLQNQLLVFVDEVVEAMIVLKW